MLRVTKNNNLKRKLASKIPETDNKSVILVVKQSLKCSKT